MKLFFDEDNGTGIPRALSLVRLPGDAIAFSSNGNHQLVKKGTPDREWIPVIGDLGYLVFSQNKAMLQNHEERQLLIEHHVGIVFLGSGNDKAFPVLRMLMHRWDWLRLIDSTAQRPFAYIITLAGNSRKLDIYAPSPLATDRIRGSIVDGGPAVVQADSSRDPSGGPPDGSMRLPGL